MINYLTRSTTEPTDPTDPNPEEEQPLEPTPEEEDSPFEDNTGNRDEILNAKRL